jgi:hypothetical protein
LSRAHARPGIPIRSVRYEPGPRGGWRGCGCCGDGLGGDRGRSATKSKPLRQSFSPPSACGPGPCEPSLFRHARAEGGARTGREALTPPPLREMSFPRWAPPARTERPLLAGTCRAHRSARWLHRTQRSIGRPSTRFWSCSIRSRRWRCVADHRVWKRRRPALPMEPYSESIIWADLPISASSICDAVDQLLDQGQHVVQSWPRRKWPTAPASGRH